MKKLSITAAVLSAAFVGAAGAADVTLYYSPTCPHCHNAREFISSKLVYEYPTVNVTAVNVADDGNIDAFRDALAKCNYDSGGVPVLVIGDKCFQGYANVMDNEIRDAVSVDMNDADKATAATNKAAMDKDADKFRSDNASRANVIVEYATESQKKTEVNPNVYFYGLLILLVAGLGFVLLRQPKKK